LAVSKIREIEAGTSKKEKMNALEPYALGKLGSIEKMISSKHSYFPNFQIFKLHFDRLTRKSKLGPQKIDNEMC
jgi:hypothetical protein